MQGWWAEETSLKKNIKNLTVQKLLNGSVGYIICGGWPPGPKNGRADFFVPVQSCMEATEF